jgi:hypothetical protein
MKRPLRVLAAIIGIGGVLCGAAVFALSSRPGRISAVTHQPLRASATVYNFSVDRNENYFVGHKPLLVHNCAPETYTYVRGAAGKEADAAIAGNGNLGRVRPEMSPTGRYGGRPEGLRPALPLDAPVGQNRVIQQATVYAKMGPDGKILIYRSNTPYPISPSHAVDSSWGPPWGVVDLPPNADLTDLIGVSDFPKVTVIGSGKNAQIVLEYPEGSCSTLVKRGG